MSGSSDEAGKTAEEIAAGVAAGIVTVGIPAPVGPALGAVTSPVLLATARALRKYQKKQWGRALDIIELAAKDAGLTTTELMRRFETSPGHEDLFIRAMRAAGDSATRRKLVALGQSLARAASETEPGPIEWETLFVRTMANLDDPQLTLLERFGWSANHLGLGDPANPDFDVPPDTLNQVQMKMILPDYEEVLPALVAALEGQGVITSQPESGMGFSGQWWLTEFGRQVLARLQAVAAILG